MYYIIVVVIVMLSFQCEQKAFDNFYLNVPRYYNVKMNHVYAMFDKGFKLLSDSLITSILLLSPGHADKTNKL